MPVAPRGYIEEDDPRVSQIGHPAPPWMTPYADLMTEMVCFFVILYGLSSALDQNLNKIVRQMERDIESSSEIKVETQYTRQGVRIELQEGEEAEGDEEGPEPGDQPADEGLSVDRHAKDKSFLFQSGRATLTPALKQVLDVIAPKLREINENKEIVVEGHTDPARLRRGSRYRDNLELSTARAGNVVRYLTGKHAFKPANVAAVGYGEHHPKVPNDSPQNMQINRRIVFFIKNAKPYVPPWLRSGPDAPEPGGGEKPEIETVEAEP